MQRTCFQTKSHSEVTDGHESWANTVQPGTEDNQQMLTRLSLSYTKIGVQDPFCLNFLKF